MKSRDRWTLALLALVTGLVPAFMRGLWEPDEARYAEIPREMLASGDWLTPKLNGALYFEKPPLQYWLSAISMKLFGVNGVAAKLPLLLAAALVIWAAVRLAGRLGARGPVWAGVMASTTLLAFVTGQILTLDALFSAFLVAGLACGVEAVGAKVEGRSQRFWALGAHAFLAAAFLTKGLAAVVILGGVFLLSVYFAKGDRDLRRAVLGLLFDPLGLLLAVGLAAPWFIAVEKANPGHARFFFIHEHFTRFASHAHARQGSDNWFLDKLYFLPILAVGLLPWLSASVVGLNRATRLAFGKSAFQGAALHRWTVGAALLGAAWPFVFFTLSGSKLPPYILPAVVPLVALACTFEREGEEVKSLTRIGTELAILGAALLIGGLVAKEADLGGARNWVLALGLAALLVGLWCRRPTWPVMPTVPAFLTGLCGVLLGLVFVGQKVAGPNKEVAHLLAQAPREARWISFGNLFQGIPFATGERMVIVAGTGELAFGRGRLSPEDQDRWMPEAREDLLPTARRMAAESPGRPVWVLADRRDWEMLAPEQRAAFEVRSRSRSVFLLELAGGGAGPE